MALSLVPPADPEVVEAARRAVVSAGAEAGADDHRGRWWRAGVEDVVAGRAVTPARVPSYVVAWPRSTRGATRA